MKPEIHVGKEVHNPNYDIQLTDVSGKSVGLILANTRGASDRRGIMQSAMPRTAMQMSAGGNSYDDMEMPYTVEVQSSMIGGRGMDDFTKDKTRYADGFRMDTSSVSPILGPGYVVQGGYKLVSKMFDEPENPHYWYPFIPGPEPTMVQDLNHYFISGTKTITGTGVFLHGWEGPMTVHYNVSKFMDGVDPNINGPDYTVPYSKVVYGNGTDQWIDLPLPIPLIATDERINWSWGTDKESYILTAKDPSLIPGFGSETSYGGETFSANFGGDPIGWMSSLTFEATCEYKFFEYKRCLYMIKNYSDRSGSVVYRNGIRGIAAPNSGANLNKIVSTNPASLPTLPDIRGVGLISNGPGEMERQNWRNVSSVGGSTLICSDIWNVTHTVATEYVLLNTDIWTQVATYSFNITDVLALQDYCLFAFGDDAALSYYRELNVANVWTVQTTADTNGNKYNFLELTQDIKGRLQIWGANANSCQVSYSWVPAYGVAMVFDIWEVEKTQFAVTRTRLVADLAATPATDEYIAVRNRLTNQIADVDTEVAKLITFIQAGDTSSHITNMIIYGAPGIPYILKEGEIGSIDQNVYSKIPIAELQSVRSERNGKAAMAYGVYLYFNLEGGWIERYYDQRMDDVSPNQNEGLPRERQGEISKIMPYAGRWYASINAGTGGISSVLMNNELGWHEVYRSHQVGLPITDIYVQAIPGISNPDVLWIAEGGNVYKIPISISPLKQDNYLYYGVGLPKDQCPSIETAWIDMNYKDVNKYFHSLNLFMDMPGRTISTGNEYKTYVWYKTDMTEPNVWKYLGSGNALTGGQEFPILLDGEYKVWGKQIKFKIAMQSNNVYYTPRLKAWVCNAIVRFEIKKSWQLTFQLQPDKDLLGTKVIMDPNEIYETVDTWANSKWHATPLRMRTNDPVSDGALVFVDPMSLTRTSVDLALNNKGSKKSFVAIASVLVFEV